MFGIIVKLVVLVLSSLVSERCKSASLAQKQDYIIRISAHGTRWMDATIVHNCRMLTLPMLHVVGRSP